MERDNENSIWSENQNIGDSLQSTKAKDKPTDESASSPARKSDGGVSVLKDIANTASGELGRAAEALSEAVEKAATAVGAAVSEARVKAVNELDSVDDKKLGPYSSPGTCVPSDFDPIVGALQAGMVMKQNTEDTGEEAAEGKKNT